MPALTDLSERSQRKLDHLRLAPRTRSGQTGFRDITLVHRSLPELALSEIDLTTELGGFHLPYPILINAMTGGVQEAETINRNLGRLSRELSLPVAVGSQRAALSNPPLARTYRVLREANPHGIVLANLGAGASPSEAEDAIAMMSANLLQLHLNAPQEIAMMEGDRDFRGQLRAIERVRAHVRIPLIVKECGFGMSRETARQLWDVGVRLIDVAGHGGTNFSRVEYARRPPGGERDPALLDWGIPTAASLWEVAEARLPGLEVIASGGIRFGSDIAKSVALGAGLAAMAGTVMRALQEDGFEGARRQLETVRDDLARTCLLAGARTLRDLRHTPMVIQGATRSWIDARTRFFEEHPWGVRS